jgi:DNA topoisomerase I
VRLRQSDPRKAGYRRVRRGRGFRYFDPNGALVEDAACLQRFRELVIPPAWKDVWICPWPNGHLQAIGTDDAGRRQYLYHPRFRAQQEQAKHEHVLEIAARLPEARKQIGADLESRGLPRQRVLACGARLLDLGFFRIGSDRYAQTNGSYGLTTILRGHVEVQHGGLLVFSYIAKGGQERVQAVADPATRKAIAALLKQRAPEERLLAYRDRHADNAWHEVHSADLNAYLKDLFGTDVSAKDFRTWHATVLAAVALAVSTAAASSGVTARKRAEVRAVKEVASYLGNTPAVCRASYINPRVFEFYEQGKTVAPTLGALGRDTAFGEPATQGPVEQAVLDLLTEP